MYEVELEEHGCISKLGKHGIRMTHRPNMLLGLSVDRAEVNGETKSFTAIVQNDEWGKSPFRRRVPVDVAHFQQFIALCLHGFQLQNSLCAIDI